MQALTLSRVRVAAALVVFVFTLDGVAEFVFQPNMFRANFWVRVGAGAFVLLLFCFSYWKLAYRLAFPLVIVLGLAVALDVETAILESGGLASPFTTGLALLIIAAALFVPFSARQMALSSTVLWAVYLVPILATRTPVDRGGAWVQGFLLACATVIAVTASRVTSALRRQEFMSRQALAWEQQKSEHLLLNILPEPIADRLKEEEKDIADAFPRVTILFADIVDFTQISAHMSPEEVVSLLNEVFSEFDRLTDKHGLEKIKTIGDAYMVVGGLPQPRPDHLEAVAEMGLDMRDAITRLAPRDGDRLQIRIGIHTGPVVAGVIGRTKFAYDLWGDAVNTASRMESSGSPGHIQVTREVYERLCDRYAFEERGVQSIKGKGEMRTYFLLGRRGPEVNHHGPDMTPNSGSRLS